MANTVVRDGTLSLSLPGKIIIHLLLISMALLCILPLMLIISVSLSDESDIINYGFRLIPVNISFKAYTAIFRNPFRIVNAYKITVIVTLTGTFLSVLMTAMIAYALYRNDFKYKRFISFYLFFTMLFSGGLVPFYILVTRYLSLTDNILVLIIPYLVSPWNIFLQRTYFQKIPSSLVESAKIDGAREIRIFRQIILPLSTPSLATIGLFYALTYWNDWWLSLLFINKPKLYSLQMLLKTISENIDFIRQSAQISSDMVNDAEIPTESMKMATCLVVIGPMAVVFPFIQKYFVTGLTIGSVKG